MSRAHDKYLVYPDEQGNIKKMEVTYEQYRKRIRKYLSLKVNPVIAEDLTQQVFLKAMENINTFKGNSSLFTWIFKIAQNTVKNEFRSLSRKKEILYDFTGYESQSISLDFAKYVDIRIDISSALKKLNELDQQIISLRFFVDCTLFEISKIVEMRESAVKNRLYRSLEKLRRELKEWGDITIMSIQEMISIESKSEPADKNDSLQKVYQDLFKELKDNVEKISLKFNHHLSKKITIEIYPDLPTLHQAVGETNAPDWFMGTFEEDIIKIVSPLNPGPEHTYQTIIKSTLHLFTMWLISDINPLSPQWLCQGIGGYEIKQMTQDYIENTTSEAILKLEIPSFQELNNDTWHFETINGFQFSYLFVKFIVDEYGLDILNKFIRNPNDFHGIFQLAELDLHKQWVGHIRNK
jgi:RNA polymerase sigma-70 factor, ECF subfamily